MDDVLGDAGPRPVGRCSTPGERARAMGRPGSLGAGRVVGVSPSVDRGVSGTVQTGQIDVSALLPGG
jgi:hypothetical protein